MGRVETRLIPYFLASRAAANGNYRLMEQRLEAVRVITPLSVRVNQRKHIEVMKEAGYRKAAKILWQRAADSVSVMSIREAMDYFEEFKHCYDQLNGKGLEEDMSMLEYHVETARLIDSGQ